MLSTHPSIKDRLVWWAFAFIAVNALAWWWLYSAGRSSLDTYGDMAEAYSWGISWQWGYDKHPPLSAWTAAAWFKLFPTVDWAYYLLAMVNQGVAFWFVFLAGRRWMPASAALLAVMLTSLVPLFGPDTGFKFNANSAMLPWLAIFAWSLFVAIQDRSYRFAILAGITSGLACLVKYWAPLMLASIAAGVLLITYEGKTMHWPSVARKITVVSGITALMFAPHFTWAVVHHWPGLSYAHASHSLRNETSTFCATLNVLVDLVLVAVLPMIAWTFSVGYAKFAARDTLNVSAEPELSGSRLLNPAIGASIFILATLLTLESAHLAGVSVASKWLIPAWLFFAWPLASALPFKLNPYRLLLPIATIIGIYWIGLACYVASINPSLSMVRDATNQRRVVANEVTQRFHRLFGAPLQFVAGDEAMTFSTSFYSDDHPVAIANLDFVRTSWVDETAVRKAGLVVLCDEPDSDCVNRTQGRLGPADSTSVWQGLSDDGKSAKVHELFYRPGTQRSYAMGTVADVP